MTKTVEKTTAEKMAEVSLEYSCALAEIEYLLPQYKAAVARYTKARREMKDFISEKDEAINLF